MKAIRKQNERIRIEWLTRVIDETKILKITKEALRS